MEGQGPSGPPVDSGNVPSNPLRSYRMSMLSHGFVQEDSDSEWVPDENQPMSYAVIRMARTPVLATLLVGLAVVALIVMAWFVG